MVLVKINFRKKSIDLGGNEERIEFFLIQG